MRTRIVIEPSFQSLLEKLDLTSIEGVRRFSATLLKTQRGRREIIRFSGRTAEGRETVFFLKRTSKAYLKNGLNSLLLRGAVWSTAREEWENTRTFQNAGILTPQLVAWGEICGPFKEEFSFLITAAAPGTLTIGDFVWAEKNPQMRKAVFKGLALEIARMHQCGLGTPDLFARHIFIEPSNPETRFCFIDLARIHEEEVLSSKKRSEDLAALNVTLPAAAVTLKERLEFIRNYCPESDRRQFWKAIVRRSLYLLRRRKYQQVFYSKPPG